MRHPAVAGQFYPARPEDLRREVRRLLDGASDLALTGTLYAAIAPHAGYVYSGAVAARTHKALARTQFDTLVIIGHDAYRGAVAYLSSADAFETPLGPVPVDCEMVEKMASFHRGIRVDERVHARDHTVEVQLPFLQVLGISCKIVPVLFGDPTPENCRILADSILAAQGNRRVIILASTDMSHYPPYEHACRIDRATLDVLRQMDLSRLFDHLNQQERQATVPDLQTALCARGGVGTAILFAKAKGAATVTILTYANSGDVPVGSKESVVGYGAALMTGPTD